MRIEHLKLLSCPNCRSDLDLREKIMASDGNRISSGKLICGRCDVDYPIKLGIPRFVSSNNYAKGFGYEWKLHEKTQLDRYTGVKASEKRFFEETKWKRSLQGESILEIGCGAGRFTEHALSTGALVVSLDYSEAVEVNYERNKENCNFLAMQADIFNLPFKTPFFDKLFCLGVLQHTPNPKLAFEQLEKHVKSGGVIVSDVYRKTFFTYFGLRYYIRPFVNRANPEELYRRTKKYIDTVWPFSKIIRKIPLIGSKLNWALLIPDYSREGLSEEMLKEWAYLDIFDILSPEYDLPQTLTTVKAWVKDGPFVNSDVQYGYNGIEIRVTKK